MKTKAIIIDLDGTLCNVDHRLYILHEAKKSGNEPDWKKWTLNCEYDRLNEWCKVTLTVFNKSHYKIILLTGRPAGEPSLKEIYREMTIKWLVHHGIEYDELIMRDALDISTDDDYKKNVYLQQIYPKYDVLFVLEDRPSVCRMWRKLGVVCFQVNDIEF